ncbi:MAG: hypothetical protein ACTHMT_05880 [Verrucomicrobiota bacterium]
MKLLVFAWVGICCFLISGCSTARITNPRVYRVDKPPINVDAVAELGDTVLDRGLIKAYPGLRLSDDLVRRFWNCSIRIPSGDLKCSYEDTNWLYFESPQGLQATFNSGRVSILRGGIAANKKNQRELRFWEINLIQPGRKIEPIPNFTLLPSLEPLIGSFKQELIYNGRAGDIVKFLYREISNDYLRGPFSQEIQYDLSEGTRIGFKGARIEILSASNEELRYKVLKSFPSNLPEIKLPEEVEKPVKNQQVQAGKRISS